MPMAHNRASQQADGKQAYTQALMKGVDTWVELPRDRWPKDCMTDQLADSESPFTDTPIPGGCGRSTANVC